MEIAMKHTKIGPTFSCIRKNLPKYDILGTHRYVDEDSRILRRYVMSEWYIDNEVSKGNFGLLFRTK
jgi:hypothetical protein